MQIGPSLSIKVTKSHAQIAWGPLMATIHKTKFGKDQKSERFRILGVFQEANSEHFLSISPDLHAYTLTALPPYYWLPNLSHHTAPF